MLVKELSNYLTADQLKDFNIPETEEDVCINDFKCSVQKWSLLEYAIQKKNLAFALYLVEKGSDPNKPFQVAFPNSELSYDTPLTATIQLTKINLQKDLRNQLIKELLKRYLFRFI